MQSRALGICLCTQAWRFHMVRRMSLAFAQIRAQIRASLPTQSHALQTFITNTELRTSRPLVHGTTVQFATSPTAIPLLQQNTARMNILGQRWPENGYLHLLNAMKAFRAAGDEAMVGLLYGVLASTARFGDDWDLVLWAARHWWLMPRTEAMRLGHVSVQSARQTVKHAARIISHVDRGQAMVLWHAANRGEMVEMSMKYGLVIRS